MFKTFKRGFLLALALSLPVFCQSGQEQQQQGKGQQKQKGQQTQEEQQKVRDQKPQASLTTKTTRGVNESCDGALNIVPTGSMTFARKRRPARIENKSGKVSAPAPERERKPEERGPGSGN